MMEVTGVFSLKDGRRVICGESLWEHNITHKVGDILVCGSKRWAVKAVERFHQGCFGIPTLRYHGLYLEPLEHNDMPNIKDILVKE
jgi:hypothetical protein